MPLDLGSGGDGYIEELIEDVLIEHDRIVLVSLEGVFSSWLRARLRTAGYTASTNSFGIVSVTVLDRDGPSNTTPAG
jgi:hypothetical protein